MRHSILLKRLRHAAGLAAVLIASPAFAQTPVSTSVQFSGSCSKCDLSHRNMERVSLQQSNFSESDFSHSNLSGGKFYKSNLAGAIFNKTYMMRVEGEGVILKKSNLRDATLTEATLINSDLSYADMRRADLTRGNFKGSSFNGAILKSADAVKANFESAIMTGAKLTHANFTDANFTNAKLYRADFGDATVTNCDFTDANLSGANLFHVNGLKRDQLSSACGDETTILPSGMTIAVCPEIKAPKILARLSDRMSALETAAPPATPQTLSIFLDSADHMAEIRQEISALDMASKKISTAMRDLPLGSPTRAHLEAAQRYLETARLELEE